MRVESERGRGHDDGMRDLRTEIQQAERWQLIRYIASAIHGYTIMNREPGLSVETKAEINQMIHYLAGHAMQLADPDKVIAEWQLDSLVESVSLLDPTLRSNARALLLG